MTVNRPGEEWLLEYAVGSLPEPLSLMVATHLTLVPESRQHVRTLEAVGGALLDDLEPISVSEGVFDSLLARLDEAVPEPTAALRTEAEIPAPLNDYLPDRGHDLRWSPVIPGVSQIKLLPDRKDYWTRLIRTRAGRPTLQHTHEGLEWTLVLTGAFRDQTGHYGRGDVVVADDSIDHTPIADPGEDCICLVVGQGRVRLTGTIGRLIDPLLRRA